jgi:hypothetical protein
MKTLQKIIVFLLLILPVIGIAETKEIPFTLDDRDRIIRTEQKVEALNAKIDNKVDGLRNEVNAKFDGLRSEMNTRFDQLFSFLWAIIGIFTTMMVSVLGFGINRNFWGASGISKEISGLAFQISDFRFQISH